MSTIALPGQKAEPFTGERGCEFARWRHFRHSEISLLFCNVGLAGEAHSTPGPVITRLQQRRLSSEAVEAVLFSNKE